jgi:rubrerythrin
MEQPEAPVAIPEKLPQPQNQEWLAKLREVLALTQLSRAQYAVDRAKFQAHRPYQKVIPQEEEHVKWLNALFKAYGLPVEVKTPLVRDAKTLKEAYEIAMKLEADLFAPYQWLIRNAEDQTSAQVLTTILYQSRRHYRMFKNALQRSGDGNLDEKN